MAKITHFVNTGTPAGVTRQKWIDSFQGSEVDIMLMHEKEDVTMYITKDRPGDPYPRMPVYHVWHGDHWAYCGQSLGKAFDVFERETKKITQ